MFMPDLFYLIWIAPALILGFLAQMWISAAYSRGQSIPASTSGFGAARALLDAAGLHDVQIEPIPGHLSDHYDPRDKVLRLSNDVFNGRSLAAVGIAAHEAGHALQDANGYIPLVVRNMAVPLSNIGSNFGLTMAAIGVIFSI